ncbi:ZPR1 zinc finger domain-containing protein [Methanofervidicoccus abyssi]|uniref:Zinc finger protein n=1 Tax=Methanofervidicoccus abyssi TaxID=2082189 RepID=A0A401HRZ1_9EURY|nr:ZPR1 zinc finger domain-containing protein [Methanofervidicoccus abyssi]GBF36985.1 zinc finger protein [Methanofervidicoccus abyssi]
MENIKPVNVIDCPICGGKNTFKIFSNQLDIPYFGKVMETTMICDKCKYRKSDIIPLEVKEPKRYILRVCGEEDLNKRVVRSSTGYIKIPEWGFEVRPGPASEGYISNVEGVLNRLEDSLKMLLKWVDGEEKRKGEEILKKIEDVKRGKENITLIIEDPLGHSAIIGDGVKEEKLSEEEIKILSGGNIFIMEKNKNK